MRVLWRAAWAAMLFLATGTGARADLLYGFSGNVPDGPVDATVSFTLGNGTVHIVVNSLLANPTSDGQLVSGIDFTISGAASTGSLTDATGLISYIDTSNGKYTAGVSQGLTQAAVTHHSVWALTGAGELTTLSATKPEFLIIGPDDKGSFTNVGLYSAANSSISQHNPVVLGTATFDLAIPGISPTSTISGVQIEFGTGPVTEDANLLTSVPEPSSAILLSGLAGLVLVGRRFCR